MLTNQKMKKSKPIEAVITEMPKGHMEASTMEKTIPVMDDTTSAVTTMPNEGTQNRMVQMSKFIAVVEGMPQPGMGYHGVGEAEYLPAGLANCRLDVFAIGSDRALWHNWQTAPNNGWSGWASMGGWVNAPAVGRNADGRSEVFVIGSDHALWHNWQGGPWSGWASLGGWIDRLAIGKNEDGRLEIFARGSDQALWHNWQTAPNSGWSGWASMGGVVDSPVVATNADGRMELFVIGSDHALWHNWQTAPNSGWSGWYSMGGWIDRLTVGQNADGRLEVFARGSDQALWHNWQTAPNGGWSGWASMGGVVNSPVAGTNADGRMELFVIGSDHALWHNWQTAPNNGWSGWYSMGGWIDRLVVGQNADGRLEVFARGSDQALWHIWQTAPNNGWSSWGSMGGWIDQIVVGQEILTAITLNVQLLPQQTNSWCWAASAEMIMKYEGHDTAQCQQANHEFGRTDCCLSPTPSQCVKGGWPQFDAWGFQSAHTNSGTALTFGQLQAQINANMPIWFSWWWTGGGGHAMVARGYNASKSQLVLINDPWPPNKGDIRWISYADFVATKGDHDHAVDYYNIRFTNTFTGKEEPVMEPESTKINNPVGYTDAETTAIEALKMFPELVTPDNAQEMGFETVPNDVASLSLGKPLPIFYIRHNALLAYNTNMVVDDLLTSNDELLFPVIKDGKVISSITVRKDDRLWRFESLGDHNLINDITEARDSESAKSGKDAPTYILVKIPSMYQLFIGHHDPSGKLKLTNVHEKAEMGFIKHKTQPAEETIDTIISSAKVTRPGIPDRF